MQTEYHYDTKERQIKTPAPSPYNNGNRGEEINIPHGTTLIRQHSPRSLNASARCP